MCCLADEFDPTVTSGTLAMGGDPATAGRDAAGVLERGATFGRHRILSLLGEGGMGRVYAAEQTDSGRIVAIKVLTKQWAGVEQRNRLLREARLAASVGHPNTVFVFGAEDSAAGPAIVLELVAGGTLKDRLAAFGPLPAAEVVRTAIQLAQGLEAVHAAGILHRDIKPSNCFLEPDGTAKLGDFGISRPAHRENQTVADTTANVSFAGTPGYASPEQLQGEPLRASTDIYAMGATLYHLLTGRAPFEQADLIQQIAAVMTKIPDSPRSLQREIPEEVSAIVMKCLSKASTERYQSAAELREALQSAMSPPEIATVWQRALAGIIDGLPSMIIRGVLSLSGAERAGIEFGLAAAYGIGEGLWRVSPGKLFLGLRVTDLTGRPLGLFRGLLRSFLLEAPLVAYWALSPQGLRAVGNPTGTELAGIAMFVLSSLAMFLPTLWRSGCVGLHDLAVGAQVVPARQAVSPVDAPALDRDRALPEPSGVGRFLGSYQLIGVVSSDQGRTIWDAWDPLLHRRLWIVEYDGSQPPLLPERRELRRPGRIRWLGGIRKETECWDAFERVAGQPVLEYSNPVEWPDLALWLGTIGKEIALDPPLQDGLTTGQIWISHDGRAIVLDFPVVKPEHEDVCGPARVLQEITLRFAPKMQQSGVPRRVTAFFDATRTGVIPPLTLYENLTALLAPYRNKSMRFSRSRKMLILAVFTVAFAASIQLPPYSDSEKALAAVHERIVALERANAREAETLKNFAAVEFHGELRTLRRNRPVWYEELKDRRPAAEQLLTTQQRRTISRALYGKRLEFVEILCALEVLLAFAGALLFRLHWSWIVSTHSLVLLNRLGEPANRATYGARAALVGAPAVIGVLLNRYVGSPWPLAAVALVYAAGILYSIQSPNRGPADHLLGTTIVPR